MVDYNKFYKQQAKREENRKAKISKATQKKVFDIMCENARKRDTKKQTKN